MPVAIGSSEVTARPTNEPVNALSFDIEDWFHIVDIEGLDPGTWDSRESIVEQRTDEILALLRRHGARATFFILGWIADRHPGLVRRIAEAGHEIGSHSYWHRPVYSLSREEFHEDTARSIEAIERACGVRPVCYRAPSFSIVQGCEWAFDVLHDCGIKWDASLFPGGRGHGGYPCRDEPFLFRGAPSGRAMPELPLGLMRVFGGGICFSGGGYFRLLPKTLLRLGFHLHAKRGLPVVTYLHPRDFAPDCPRVPMPVNRRFKCYVGLSSTRPKLEWLLKRFRFAPCGEVLRSAGLLEQERSSAALAAAVPIAPFQGSAAGSGTSAASSVRILMLNQYFWPDVAATAQHAFDLAKFLEERGDRVTVIASRSVYGRSCGALPDVEVHGGIKIHRVGSSLFGRRGLLSRLLDFGAFNVACLFKAVSLPKHDVVVCLTTPPFIAAVGWLLRLTQGTRFVFWTMDLYPDVPRAAGILKSKSLALKVLDWIDRFLLRHADKVVVLGRCMRERVLAKGVDPERVSLISPWADPTEVVDIPAPGFETPVNLLAITRASASGVRPNTVPPNPFREEWQIGDRFVIEYSGNCGVGHDVSSVCSAMMHLRDDDLIRWVFVGGGVMRPVIEDFIRAHGIKNVVMKPYQPRERLSELISLGDAHLVLVADGFSGLLLPSKFYGIMAAGRPTIYVGPGDSEVAQVITEHHCGYSMRNGDGRALVTAIRDLQRNPPSALAMGLRGRRVLEARYSMQRACGDWMRLIHEIAEVRP